MSEPQPYHRQHIDCPNCNGLGAIGILQDGEMRYGRCLCEAGEANYKGMPSAGVVNYPFKSDGKMAASGEQLDEEVIPF